MVQRIKRITGPSQGRCLVGYLGLGLIWLVGSSLASVAFRSTGSVAHAATTPTWVTTSGTTVNLTIIAGYNTSNAGFNFNGAAHGQMTITVPLGDKVVVTYKNNVQTPHNVDIINYTSTLPGNGTAPAFTGASSPMPRFGPGGPASAGKPEVFSFTASKAGTYMLICGVSGHALAGMWDTFVVSSSAKAASVSFSAAGVTLGSAPQATTTNMPTWVTTTGTTVHLSLISGWNNVNAGFNFNGAARGGMVVTIPLGAKVVATYKNNVPVFHDVDIINYVSPLPSHSNPPAFPGSRSPLPSFGGGGAGRGGPPAGGTGGRSGPPAGGFPAQSNKPVTFTFTASRAGTFLIICGVPGHALAGMWDTLVVSASSKTASVTFK